MELILPLYMDREAYFQSCETVEQSFTATHLESQAKGPRKLQRPSYKPTQAGSLIKTSATVEHSLWLHVTNEPEQ